MLRSVKSLRGQPIVALDGPIGFLVDLYFDDRDWKVRYLVLDTGRPMPQRQVLVDPARVVPDEDSRIHVRLTRRQVEMCPQLDDDPPVYLQYDLVHLTAPGDPHLRSAEVVMGFAVPGHGHLRDILVDIQGWTIASFVVDSGVWLPGKRSLIAPRDVAGLDWIERAVELYRSSVAPRMAP